MKTITIDPVAAEAGTAAYVDTVTVAAWFELARAEYLQWLPGHVGSQNETFTLASVSLDHLGVCSEGEQVAVEISATNDIGKSSFQLACRIYQCGQLKVVGKAVMVYVARDGWRPLPIADVLRKQLQHEALSFQRLPSAGFAALHAAADS